jgi:hypothetical protein
VFKPRPSRTDCASMSSGNTNATCSVVYDVSGGDLDPRFPIWRPRNVNMVDGRPFVALGERDHMLKGYLGVRNCHGFFLHLAKKRNYAVDELLLAKIREVDEFAMAVPFSARKNPPEINQKSIILAVGDDSSIEVLIELIPAKKVSVLLTAPNLHALSEYAKDYAAQAASPRKRARFKAPIVCCGQAFVKKNVGRKTVSAICRDSAGTAVRKILKVNGRWTQDSVDVVVDELTEYLRHAHHVEVNGEMVLASVHHLEMFAVDDIDARSCESADAEREESQAESADAPADDTIDG